MVVKHYPEPEKNDDTYKLPFMHVCVSVSKGGTPGKNIP